jgi:hypothetical protein
MTTRDGTSSLLLYPSGTFFDPLAPDPAKIRVADVAHGLSVIPRFGGHTARPYMVAQHCVLVSRVIERAPFVESAPHMGLDFRDAALFGLLHEVAEALSGFGDVCGPVKRVPHVAAVIKPIERAIERAAALRWGFPEDFASLPIVKWADRFVLDWEDRDLRDEGLPPHLGYAETDPGRRTGAEVECGPPLPEEKIVAWPWCDVRRRFLERYAALAQCSPMAQRALAGALGD